MSSGGCSYLIGEKCSKMNMKKCVLGMKGCVLENRYKIGDDFDDADAGGSQADESKNVQDDASNDD